MRIPTNDSQQTRELHAFLLRAAELLHQHGTPSYRLEAVMTKVATGLGVPSTFLYTPTALVVALGQEDEERTYLRRVESGDVDISKLVAFDEILDALESERITISQASEQLELAASAPAPFPLPVLLAAAAIACASVAVIFGGNANDTVIAGLFGAMIAFVSVRINPKTVPRAFLEPLFGFSVATAAIAIGHWLPVDHRLITLAALILPIPGLALTVALTELAVGHLSSGSARLAGAAVRLLTLVLGVAIAWGMCTWSQVNADAVESLPPWCLWIAVGLTPFAFAIVFKAPLSQWLIIAFVVISGFVASRIGSQLAAPEVGAFCGALVVGCGSNVYARLSNRPAMAPQTPGLLILVPGSIGYQSLTAMVQNETIKGVEFAFSMTIVGIALVGGLLLANQILPPKRIL